MANTLKFGNGNWATKEDSVLAYNDENNNFKPLPFDFTRASTATYVDSDGLIKTAGNAEARVDYTDSTKGALLLEPARSNSIQYSEDFSNAAWVSLGSSITLNSIVSPDGTLNASKIFGDGSQPYVAIKDNIVFSSTGEYTLSVYAKVGNNNFLRLQFAGVTNGSSAYYDLENGTTSSSGASIVYVGNGWYRCILTNNLTGVDLTGAVQIFASYSTSASTFPSVSDATNQNIYLWGAQIEAGSYATSYIPTSGSSVTRVAEFSSQTGVEQVIGQSEGTMYIEFIPLDASATQILFQIRTTGSSNSGQIDFRLQSGAIRTLGNDAGSNQFSFSGGSYTVGTTYKVAVRYKTNDTKLYINGLFAGSDTTCSFSSSTKQQISFNEDTSILPALAKIKDARLYTTALTDAELATLTT
mgnify:CR=1 FL=1